MGRQLRRHADVSRRTSSRRSRRGSARRRTRSGPRASWSCATPTARTRADGPDPRLGHAHRRVDLSGADDQGHAGRVLPALERPPHAVRRDPVDRGAARHQRGRLRGLHGRAVPRRRARNAHASSASPTRFRPPRCSRGCSASASASRAKDGCRLRPARSARRRHPQRPAGARGGAPKRPRAGRRQLRRRSARTWPRASTSTSRRTCRNCSIAASRPDAILEHGLIAAISEVGERMAVRRGIHPRGAAGRTRHDRRRGRCWNRTWPPAATRIAARC